MPGKVSWSPWEPPAPSDGDRKFANEFLMSLCRRYLEHEAGEGIEDIDALGTLDDVVRFLKERPGAGEGGGDAS